MFKHYIKYETRTLTFVDKKFDLIVQFLMHDKWELYEKISNLM